MKINRSAQISTTHVHSNVQKTYKQKKAVQPTRAMKYLWQLTDDWTERQKAENRNRDRDNPTYTKNWTCEKMTIHLKRRTVTHDQTINTF